MVKAKKKAAKKSKYNTPIKIKGSPDEVLKAMLNTPKKKTKKR